jgi:MFS transporter, DHA2 family, multidrug resistance protein
VSVIGMLLVRGTPESKVEASGDYTFDTKGILTFLVTTVALQVFATQGVRLGWTSPASLGLLALSLVFGFLFFRAETPRRNIGGLADIR